MEPMKTPQSFLPDLPTLTVRLAAALDGYDASRHPLKVLQRKLPRFMSTFPNEILTCQLADGRKRRVFIKYEAGHGHRSYGHRGNVAYEAEVYQRLLDSLQGFRPKCLGVSADPASGDTWLILEYVYGSVRLSDLSSHSSTRQPQALVDSARWIGRFHAALEARVAEPSLSFLKRYDAQYYRGWAQRTFEFARPLEARFPWLVELRQSGDAWFAPLLAAPPTVMHGEFYAKTVLIRNQDLFMVDWESAAIAAGEIDLATLTEGTGWPRKLVRQCERAYQRARWPGVAPAEFHQTLEAAKVYLHFRWLGDRPEKALSEKNRWRYRHLRLAAKTLGLI
jgi:hypothetical protein